MLICTIALASLGCGRTIQYHVDSNFSVDDPQFVQTMGNLLGPPLVEGNSIETLVNGDQIFPAMLDAIHSAKKTVTFETFVYWKGKIGKEFSDALSERAAHGVKVHLIIDAIGASDIDGSYLKEMGKAGVQIVTYHPLKWYDLTSAAKLNYRTHRKLLVVDGQVGFTGGVGIADEWRGHAQDPDHWRDTHYLVHGPAVLQLQSAFEDDWMESTGIVLSGEEYFPLTKSVGTHWAQVFKSSSEGGSESMELMYLLSIASARHNIRLASAYFVPDNSTIEALRKARERGVNVQIILPGKYIDERIVRTASRSCWGDLLTAGVEIYEYQPTMYHCKQMIVDDRWVSIGSSNFDNRSFRLNAEANMNVLDPTFAAGQAKLFDDDLKHSRRIGYWEWSHRPFFEKFIEGTASLLGPLL